MARKTEVEEDVRPMLTIGAVALRLSISLKSVYRLVETGELPGQRFRRSVRVRPADLEDYLERTRTAG